jgi:hypothetical protein
LKDVAVAVSVSEGYARAVDDLGQAEMCHGEAV